ncbi:MAG: serine/threonine-protein phosphatase [Alphaproteobacteria bacterium]|nr:serine/threonine-protein phosphatase [Alphaproteobacteria bacterium]MBF0391249.1 serine/threonine-protein phosphatase [Alphaproteobacteria bacterium]
MRFGFASAQEIGGRDDQQDRCAVMRGPNQALLVVADGMGGHAGGAVAAQAIIDVTADAWRRAEGRVPDPARFLGDLVAEAHHAVNRRGEELGCAPRSTMVALHLAAETGATWCHVGDSRLYRFRNGRPVGCTRDHSVAQLMLDLGELEESEMAGHPGLARLIRCMGGEDAPEPVIDAANLSDGDAFCLCTDGLWAVIEGKEIATRLVEVPLERTIRALVGEAVARGGADCDNVTAVVAKGNAYGESLLRRVVAAVVSANARGIW